MSLDDWTAAREARRERKGKRMRNVSDKKKIILDELRPWHLAVVRRDGGECQYCVLFFGTHYTPKHGDHILTQKLWPEYRLEKWNGVAACPRHNDMRNLVMVQACIASTAKGYAQFVGHAGKWFTRLVAGDHVGPWMALDADPRLRNNVLFKLEI